MGKPFSTELTRLPKTLSWTADADILAFRKFAAKARGHFLTIIGAGGSFTVAEFARMLHEEGGFAAAAHTPLSFLQSEVNLHESYVLIFTASGGNRDILATYDAAVDREPRGIFVVCGRKNSKIERKAKNHGRTEIFSRTLPAGKDGYLATNSLVAFMGMTLRAFEGDEANSAAIQPQDVAPDKELEWLDESPAPIHFLTLFGGWARSPAIDLESKFSEAGLGGVMLADYRNFAHGRHNWIHKRGSQSVVIAFLTPDSEQLARKTLAMLPPTIRVVRLSTTLTGPAGALELLLKVFRLTEQVGRKVGIDPGRPGVPAYGRRIYHLGPVISPAQECVNAMDAAISRKIWVRNSSDRTVDREIVATARDAYAASLKRQRFGALVADFDGTVIPAGAPLGSKISGAVTQLFEELMSAGIPIYFATGRGNSIHEIIANSLAEKYHPLVFVSYYNGSVTLPLMQTPPTETGGKFHDELEALLRQLQMDAFFCERARPTNKSFQLTLKIENHADCPLAAARIRETVMASFAGKLRVVESSHSLDVIPWETSKLNCVRDAQSLVGDRALLTVGDRGSLQGNDYDLLTHPYSLSVDQVSASLSSCWNLLPPGLRNVDGLIHIGKSLSIRRGFFTLKAI